MDKGVYCEAIIRGAHNGKRLSYKPKKGTPRGRKSEDMQDRSTFEEPQHHSNWPSPATRKEANREHYESIDSVLSPSAVLKAGSKRRERPNVKAL